MPPAHVHAADSREIRVVAQHEHGTLSPGERIEATPEGVALGLAGRQVRADGIPIGRDDVMGRGGAGSV
jgi:hypothetical protein